jgi:xylulose-5-phosphate/fructose-6-phosphate phosphoketolase
VSKLGSMGNFAGFLRDVMKENPKSFRVFGPDETQSNKLEKIYEVTKKVWLGEFFEEDNDGGNLALEGRVMEILSEHTVEVRLNPYT